MPELPEVETLRRELNSAIKGKTIKSAEIKWPKMVKPLTPLEFAKKIKGKKITAINRRAKVLILFLSDGNFLLIHLKLTGQLIERREVKTVSDEDYQVIRRLVIEELAQRPSLRMATPDAAPTFSQPAALTLPPSAGTLAADSVTPTPSAIPVVAEERANG